MMRLNMLLIFNKDYKCRFKSSFRLISIVIIIIVGMIRPSYEQEDLQLELVQVLFRHGDRNPIDMYPNDPWKNESFWPEGYSQLTKKGKQQHYALGQYLRQRYTGFLSSFYSPYEVFVQASDVDRTLMSAEVDLAGLFPPTDNNSLWNEDIPWQPIPVHTKPSSEDNILRMQASCPKLQKLINNFNNGPLMQQIYQENQELFEYLSNNAGKPMKTLQDVDYIYDTLFIESLHNYTIPPWAHKVFPGGKFFNLTCLSFRVLTWTPEMKRLKAGPLVKELVDHIQEKAEGKMEARKKLFIYSGHDTTIASLLNALDIFPGLPPPYASAVIFELHKNNTSGLHFVKIFYKNQSDHDPHLMTLPGCESSMCALDRVVQLTQKVIPSDWKSECECGFLGMEGLSLAVLFLGTFLSIILLISMLAVVLGRRRKIVNNPAYPYLHLQMEEDEDAEA